MLKTKEMLCLTGFYLKEDQANVITTLLDLGLAEFIDTKKLKIFEEFKFDKNSDMLANDFTELRRRSEIFLELAGINKNNINITKNLNTSQDFNLGQVETFLNEIDKDLKSHQAQQEEINHHIEEIKLDLISKKGDQTQIKKDLVMYSKALHTLTITLKNIVGPFISQLKATYKVLRYNELYSLTNSSIEKIGQFKVFSLWVLKRDLDHLLDQLKKATNGKISFETFVASDVITKEGETIEAPTYMDTPEVLAPFEELVSGYDTPAYNTVNSTPFVSLLFVVMFGLMFADVGQGFVLLLTALGLIAYNKKKQLSNMLALVLFYSSVSSIVFGLLFGSYFGFPLLPPIWFDYHGIVVTGTSHYKTAAGIDNIMQIMALSLYFGLFVIFLSFILNFINRIMRKEWINLIFNRNGIAGMVLYTALVFLLGSYVASNFKTFSFIKETIIIAIVSLILFALEEPLLDKFVKKHSPNLEKDNSETKAIKQKRKRDMINKYIMHFLIECMEFFINALSNTLSFIRIAALGIAHIGLMFAFYNIADGMDNIVLKIIICVLANVLVIVLEGFSAMVNSIRLNYYEFFSRYFLGGGQKFNPLTLKNNKQ